MRLDFAVLALPRSGTTWLANWLTTDKTLCLHDPFATAMPADWPRDRRRLGISCTGAYLVPGFVESLRCPVAVIERDVGACERSLSEMGMSGAHALAGPLARVQGRRFAYDDLWEVSTAQALWRYLVPGVAFDVLRYRLLRDMQVQPKAWSADEGVIDQLFARGMRSGNA